MRSLRENRSIVRYLTAATEQDKWECARWPLMIYYDKPLITAFRNGNRYPSLSSLEILPILNVPLRASCTNC